MEDFAIAESGLIVIGMLCDSLSKTQYQLV